ncbi:unnamed protein product [Amoebophrya sp. A25]|nr:unnamed protein product [Amoebophrya sp. A25]|eukprot:GSA25T00005066001.1
MIPSSEYKELRFIRKVKFKNPSEDLCCKRCGPQKWYGVTRSKRKTTSTNREEEYRRCRGCGKKRSTGKLVICSMECSTRSEKQGAICHRCIREKCNN